MSPPLPRTGSRRPETPDARLLTIAAEHIRRGGAERLRIVAVAEEAGMSHANVYRYFPSKADLIDAVTSAWLKGVEGNLADVAAAPDPADDKLERMVLALARDMRERAESEPRLFEMFTDAFDRNRGVARKHRIRVRSLIDRVIDEGLSVGAFEASDKDRAVVLVLDCMHRFINPLSVRQDVPMPRAAYDQRLSAAMRVVLRSLASGII